MSADAQIVEESIVKLNDIAKRIESFEMDENVRISLAIEIREEIKQLSLHFDLINA
jgi:hypothetical protein